MKGSNERRYTEQIQRILNGIDDKPSLWWGIEIKTKNESSDQNHPAVSLAVISYNCTPTMAQSNPTFPDFRWPLHPLVRNIIRSSLYLVSPMGFYQYHSLRMASFLPPQVCPSCRLSCLSCRELIFQAMARYEYGTCLYHPQLQYLLPISQTSPSPTRIQNTSSRRLHGCFSRKRIVISWFSAHCAVISISGHQIKMERFGFF